MVSFFFPLFYFPKGKPVSNKFTYLAINWFNANANNENEKCRKRKLGRNNFPKNSYYQNYLFLSFTFFFLILKLLFPPTLFSPFSQPTVLMNYVWFFFSRLDYGLWTQIIIRVERKTRNTKSGTKLIKVDIPTQY